MLRARTRQRQLEQYPPDKILHMDEDVIVFKGVPKIKRRHKYDGVQAHNQLVTPHLPANPLGINWRNRLVGPPNTTSNTTYINPFGPDVPSPKKDRDTTNLFCVVLGIRQEVLYDLWIREGQYDPKYVDPATQLPSHKLMDDDLAHKLSSDIKLIVTAGTEPYVGESDGVGFPLVFSRFYGISDLFSDTTLEPAHLYVPDTIDRSLVVARFVLDNSGYEHGSPEPPVNIVPASPLIGVAA